MIMIMIEMKKENNNKNDNCNNDNCDGTGKNEVTMKTIITAKIIWRITVMTILIQ